MSTAWTVSELCDRFFNLLSKQVIRPSDEAAHFLPTKVFSGGFVKVTELREGFRRVWSPATHLQLLFMHLYHFVSSHFQEKLKTLSIAFNHFKLSYINLLNLQQQIVSSEKLFQQTHNYVNMGGQTYWVNLAQFTCFPSLISCVSWQHTHWFCIAAVLISRWPLLFYSKSQRRAWSQFYCEADPESGAVWIKYIIIAVFSIGVRNR